MTTIFTVNGFMGDMWAGPQADTGRHLSNQGLNLAYWQPIGYECTKFPLSLGVDSGLAELRHQIDVHPGPFLFSAWSEGAIITTLWYVQARAAGPQANRLKDLRGATTFGNPYREAHTWAPKTGPGSVPDPGGSGIGGTRNNMVGTPDWWHNYAHPGDLYCCTPDNEIGEAVRIIFDFVLTQWNGAIADLMTFVFGLQRHTIQQLGGLVGAISIAIAFYGSQTREHVNYDPTPSKNYLAGIARTIR